MGGVCLVAIVFLVGMFFVWPIDRVWQREKSGQAELAEAEWNRKILLQEAESEMEAAKYLAQAEVERAKGVAQANGIIADSLKGNDAYLRYLWIQTLEKGKGKDVIYVPTEANLPIMEAGRFNASGQPRR